MTRQLQKSITYPNLSRPLEIGSKLLRNRIVMAPMCAMFSAPDGSATEQLIEYYRARAAGGAGMVIVEITFTDNLGSRAFHAQLGAHSDLMMPGLNQLAEAIRAEGALAGIQLGHSGAQRVISDPPVVAPSPIAWQPGKRVPEELTSAQIKQVVEDFVSAAGRVSDTGFDLVELHGAHGYLINTFLCPSLNQRTDDYGGTPSNRMRLALEIVQGIKKRIRPDCLLSMRLNGDDQLPGGLDMAGYVDVAKALQDAGLDALHASAGTYRVMEQRVTPMYLPEAPFLPYAIGFRKALDIPVIASGTLHDPDVNEALVAAGKVDAIALARPLFADPHLPSKLLSGKAETIIPCIRCNTCLAREQGGARARCAINPATGREYRPGGAPVRDSRRVMVVGAGPAGIQAALTARLRGHRVDLIEITDQIGGQLALAAGLQFKAPIKRLLAYYRNQLEDAGVEPSLNTAFSDVKDTLNPGDALIFAAGSRIDIPDGFGPASGPVLSAHAALASPDGVGHRVTVMGANLLGVETAMHFGQRGHEVILLDRQDTYAFDVNLINRFAFPALLAEAKVVTMFNTVASGLDRSGLRVHHKGSDETLPCDTVVVAFGRTPIDVPDQTGSTECHVVGESSGEFGLYWATQSGDHAGRLV